MKTVYQYNYDGEYTGEGIAYEDPMVPGRYALPHRTTETPPPEVGDGRVAVFREEEEGGGGWQVLEDHRKETVYDTTTGDPLIVDYIGNLRPEHTSQPPGRFQDWDGRQWVDRPLTEEEKATVIEEGSQRIDSETQANISKGFAFDGKMFSMSLSAQANWVYLLSLYNANRFPKEGFSIATQEDTDYTLSKKRALEFFEAAATHKETALAEGRRRKAELKSQYQ